MMTQFTFFAIFAGLAFHAADGTSVLEIMHLCKANDPDINACVKDAANALIPHMTKVLDEFGPAPLDPLFTPSMELLEETQYVSVDLKYTDVTQTGLSKMVVEDVKVDEKREVWKLKFSQPVFTIVGKFKSKGTILEVAVNGEGEFNSTHLDTKFEVVLEVGRETKGDGEHFKLKSLNIYYNFGTAMMEYRGLFGDDSEMQKTTNEFLNENSYRILTELKPALEKVYSDMFRGYLDQFFEKVPVNKLFVAD